MVAIAGKGWSLARSLRAMFDEADRRWPNRSHASDGSIGDKAHASRVSDHNPDASGDVLAGDLTDDKANGCDADLFAEHLRTSRDPRVKYVICNGRIFKSSGSMAWKWRPYDGLNAHDKHTHVSILDTDAAKNDLSSWFPYADAPLPEEDDMPAAPSVVIDQFNKRWVFIRGPEGHLWSLNEGAERDHGGTLTSGPSAVLRVTAKRTYIEVVARGADGASWFVEVDPSNGTNSGWKSLGGKS